VPDVDYLRVSECQGRLSQALASPFPDRLLRERRDFIAGIQSYLATATSALLLKAIYPFTESLAGVTLTSGRPWQWQWASNAASFNIGAEGQFWYRGIVLGLCRV